MHNFFLKIRHYVFLKSYGTYVGRDFIFVDILELLVTELTKCSVFFLQGWQHFKDGAKEILYSMELWRSHLKLIHGQCIDVD